MQVTECYMQKVLNTPIKNTVVRSQIIEEDSIMAPRARVLQELEAAADHVSDIS